jgi:hypothetical protein
MPHGGSFARSWKLVSIQAYGSTRPATGAGAAIHGGSPTPVTPGFEPEHHRITAVVHDDGKRLEVQVAY